MGGMKASALTFPFLDELVGGQGAPECREHLLLQLWFNHSWFASLPQTQTQQGREPPAD